MSSSASTHSATSLSTVPPAKTDAFNAGQLLTSSERVRLIKLIASTLSLESWSIIDLTLRQFQLPWTKEWSSGDEENYIIEMIDSSSDELLLELSGHLGLKALVPRKNEPLFWEENRLRAFISHKSYSFLYAEQIDQSLQKYGITSFVAHKSIEPTKKWRDEIELALFTADFLIALLMPGFRDSEWTGHEIGVAIGRNIPIIPIMFEVRPYGMIESYQAIQGSGRPIEEFSPEVFNILSRHPSVKQALFESLIHKFCCSRSFDESKKTISLLEKQVFPEPRCPLSPLLARQISQAISENDQIKNAYNSVASRARKILRIYGFS